MSTSYVLIVFAIVILLMIVLISKCKVNAAMGILLSAFILAIALGTPWQDIEKTINSGFSGTIKSVAIVIFLGCTMGTVLEKTGAAIRITKWAIGMVGEKHMIWAIALSSAILGIPIWADTVVILLIPIVSLLAVQTKKSMMSYGTALYLGALVTASLVPPTPGPVSAAALLNVPLGQAILWGAVVAIPSVIAATFYCMTLKTPVAPKEEFLAAAKETEHMQLPSLSKSLLPILGELTPENSEYEYNYFAFRICWILIFRSFCIFWRYCVGVSPTICLNALEKTKGSWYPHDSAMTQIGKSVMASCSCARVRRKLERYSLGVV